MRTRPAGPLPTDPPLLTHLGKPREAQHQKPQGGGQGGAAKPGSRCTPPHKGQRPAPPCPPPPAPPGATVHRCSLDPDLGPAGPWAGRGVLAPKAPSTRPHPTPPVTRGKGLCGPQAQGGLQKRAAPGPGHRCSLSFSTPWSPPLGRGWTQATGCRVLAGSKPRGCGGWARGEAVAQAHCPLPCWARSVPPAGPGRWPSHPPPICLVRFWARPPRRVQPPFAQPPCCPWSPSSARAPRLCPWGSPWVVRLGAGRPYCLRGCRGSEDRVMRGDG